MQSVRQIQRLNDAELEKCVPPNASWHTDYRDTAYIHVGGLPFELSEGDVLQIFSQYGNPVHVNLVRDKDTGKSRGFGFLKYEDQRSCDLAVDNLSGAGVLGRVLTVDHARYKLKEGEIEGEGMQDEDDEEDVTDTEGNARRKRRRSGSGEEESRPMLKEELELAKLLKEHDPDDPMRAYLVKEKKEQVAEALKQLSLSKSSKSKHRHRRGSTERQRHKNRRHEKRERDQEAEQDSRERLPRDELLLERESHPTEHRTWRRSRDDPEVRRRRHRSASGSSNGRTR